MDVGELQIGQKFSSFDEVKRFIENYEKTTKKKFWVRDSKRIQSLKSKKYIRNFNERISYYYVRFACIHGGYRFQSNGKGNRATKTFKADCPAFIKFFASIDGNYLELKSYSAAHNCVNMFEAVYEHLPRVGKLSDDEKCKIEDFLSVGGTIQKKVYKETNKKIILKDSNIKPIEKSQCTDLLDGMRLLTEDYEADVGLLQDEEDNFMGLYFSTERMRTLMKNYPEMITLDTTYSLLNSDLTVVLLIVIDSEGSSEIVGVALLKYKNYKTFRWFLEVFKNQNEEAVQEISCFMADKHFLKRKVIKEIFPQIPVYICRFYTMKALKRMITVEKLNISISEKEISLKLLLQLVYSTSNEKYEENYKTFCESVPHVVSEYFNKYWQPIKHEWAFCYMSNGNLKNYTNIRLESINNKIESVIPQNSSLNDFIHYFFKWLHCHECERNGKVSDLLLREQLLNFDAGSCKMQYQNLLTCFAFTYVLEQIQLSEQIPVINKVQTVYNIESSRGNLTVSINNCDCGDFTSMLLPCRHILAVRKLQGLPLFVKQLCHRRWHRDYFIKNCRILNYSDTFLPTPVTESETLTNEGETFTETEKEEETIGILNSLFSLITSSSDSQFQSKLEVLKNIENIWKSGEEIIVNEIDNNMCNESTNNKELNTAERLSNSEELSISLSSAQNTNFQYKNIVTLTPIKRKGETASSENVDLKKTRKMKIPISYIAKPTYEKQKQLLEELVINEQVVERALLEEYFVSNNDLRSCDDISNMLIDEWVNINIIKKLMQEDAFETVKTIVEYKRVNQSFVCIECEETISQPQCVICDSCLHWYHLKCLKVKSKEIPRKKYFFCDDCLVD